MLILDTYVQSEVPKVISGVLKFVTLKTHGDFLKRLYFKVI